MGTQTALRGSILTVTRRFAAGIDISERALRLAVVSKRLQANRPVCVERLEEILLPPGAVIGCDFVDRAAVAAALREAFSRLPAHGALRSLRCAMALPASATLTTRIPLAHLAHAGPMSTSALGGTPGVCLNRPCWPKPNGWRASSAAHWRSTGQSKRARMVAPRYR